MMERSYAVQAQAVRRANRDANRAETRTARRPTTTALPQAPTGPRAAVMRNESDSARPGPGAPRNEVHHGHHHQASEQDRERVGPQGLAHALAHAVAAHGVIRREKCGRPDIAPGVRR